MTESHQDPETQSISWEAFYRDYRKPGYIPGYEITRKLGGGMFGLVFKASKQSIGKDYAIKFLKVDDEEVRRALVAELESVRHFAQVDHPNLVSIEDRGEVDGIPYIVMTYAGDQTLRDRLSADDRDIEELLLFFLQACRGVHALHERSLVHFDLKPANVFIRGNVARVGDYGLSKLVAHSRNTLSMGRGTPYYMAPEILQNKGNLRSDIYSLGVILFECLTGAVPFTGDSEWEVLRKHETAEPVYPDDMAPLYQQVIGRCLAKNPEDRYPSVAEVLSALTASVDRGEEARVGGAGAERDRARSSDAKTEEDPFKDFVAAARGLSEQAKKAATEAVRSARVVGRRAVREAKRAVEDKRRDVSWHGGLWSVRSWRRLRRRMRSQEFWHGWRRRRHERRERRLRVTMGGALALLVLVVMGAVGASLTLTPAGSGASVEVQMDMDSPPPAPLDVEQRTWVAAARNGDPRAEGLLQQALAEFRAELAATSRASAGLLPSELARRSARVTASPLDVERARRAAAAVAKSYAGGDTAAALEATGHAGVVAAVSALALQEVSSSAGAKRAARLSEFLRRTLKFDGIRVNTDFAGQAHDPNLPNNRRVAAHWRWFVLLFADTAETYELYRKTVR